jgi:hypothetical protein
MMKKHFLLGATILFFGCDHIICKYKNLPDLGKGYKLETTDCKTLAIVDSKNTGMVEGLILDYAFDSTFIIASQRPWDVPDIPGIKKMNYNERNKAFENSIFRQYWIINKDQKCEYSLDTINMRALYSNVYGPYQKEEYLKKRKELCVSQAIKLKTE